MVLGKVDIHMQRMDLDSYFTSYTNSKTDERPKFKS